MLCQRFEVTFARSRRANQAQRFEFSKGDFEIRRRLFNGPQLRDILTMVGYDDALAATDFP